MLANKLNYGDTIGVVGVANSLELHNRYEDFYRFVCFGGMMYLLGTEYLPDMKDNILLIESYRTSPNECQRRFAHLKQYGMFDKVKGIAVGYNYDLQKKWRCISTNGGYIVGIYKRI